MRVSVSYNQRLDVDSLDITVRVSSQAIKEARTHVPQMQSYETPTMYLIRIADWIGTLSVAEQIQEEEGPPLTHDQIAEQEAYDAVSVTGSGRDVTCETLHLPTRHPVPPEPED